MIEECYECRYATEYLAYWWFPYFDPSCELGLPMDTDKECIDFKRLGRKSR